MIKEVNRNEESLKNISIPFEIGDDISCLIDLEDTLKDNLDKCVGMALNMIGIFKAGIVFVDDDNSIVTMINPEILKSKDEYEVEEACLSLEGARKTKRYNYIKVKFLTKDFKPRMKTYTGFTAEIIQHEIDHINGIII